MIKTLKRLKVSSSLRQRAEEYLWKNKGKAKRSEKSTENLQLLHELQVHKLELELQNQELQESRAQAEAALFHYMDLYDSALSGYFTFDNRGIILQTNLMGASFLGVERERLIGKHFATFLEKDKVFVFNDFLKKVFVTRVRQGCEVTLLKIDLEYKVLHVEGTISHDGKECRAVVQDITERLAKEKLGRLLSALTLREREIMDLVVEGKLNKQIAYTLHIAISTVEYHRARMMKKMQARNIAELVKMKTLLE